MQNGYVFMDVTMVVEFIHIGGGNRHLRSFVLFINFYEKTDIFVLS